VPIDEAGLGGEDPETALNQGTHLGGELADFVVECH
jgi:hypothetical protein